MADVPPAPHAPTHAPAADDLTLADDPGPSGGGADDVAASAAGDAPDVALVPDAADGPVDGGVVMADVPAGRRPQPHQLLALAVAVALLVAGAAGWTVTGGMPWTGHDHGRTLAGFAVNPLHNAVHVLVGAAGLVLWRRPGGVRGYGLLLALLYGAVLVYGLLAAGRSWDVLNVNGADNVLHLVLAVVGVVVAAWPPPGRGRRPRKG